jgi:hypothetical protein
MAMKIVEYVAPEKVNPYAEDVAALIKQTETKPNAAGSWTVPIDDEGKTKYKIAKAANDQGRTASFVSAIDSADGKTVTITFRIKEKHKSGPRNRRTGTAVETTA